MLVYIHSHLEWKANAALLIDYAIIMFSSRYRVLSIQRDYWSIPTNISHKCYDAMSKEISTFNCSF